jgi:uncharacterized protein
VTLYADASALVKLFVREPESAAAATFLRRTSAVATSPITRIEVARQVRIHAADRLAEVDDLFDGMTLVAFDDTVAARAESLVAAHLRTLDAIHLATAIECGARAMLVYDRRLAAGARDAGIAPAMPGATDG